MTIFDFRDRDAVGRVENVDTSAVDIAVGEDADVRSVRVDQLAVIQSRPGQHLVGYVQKILRRGFQDDEDGTPRIENGIRVTLLGTYFDRMGPRERIFRRTVEEIPRLGSFCFTLEKDRLSQFMRAVSSIEGSPDDCLRIGTYVLDPGATAYLDGDRLFQRHALIVGSTGSGKSWTTATLLEQAAALPNTNALVLDVHGEYRTLKGPGFKQLKIAGPRDLDEAKGLEDGVLHFPYWLLDYEFLRFLLIDRSDQNAPNQAMLLTRTVVEAKMHWIDKRGMADEIPDFTVDSPVPFDLHDVVRDLEGENEKMVDGTSGRPKQGDFHGKLSRMIARIRNKMSDKRLSFMFGGPAYLDDGSYLERLAAALLSGGKEAGDRGGGVKVIDLSEIPPEILPLIVGMIGRMVFEIQQWTDAGRRHPVALFCDEAHNYIPREAASESEARASVRVFERIAREGRKFGVGLVVISQRPSEVSSTVMSQCNNVVAMRLTNGEDQARVRSLLPSNLSTFADLLPVLETGEAIVAGDACVLPSRIRVFEPHAKPESDTIGFWKRWSVEDKIEPVTEAVRSWRRQSVINRHGSG